MILQNLEPKKVFTSFEEISQIPRGSGNEKEISDYVTDTNDNHGVAKAIRKFVL